MSVPYPYPTSLEGKESVHKTGVEGARRSAVIYFNKFRKLQEEMGVDDKTLCEIVGLKYNKIEPRLASWAGAQ